MTTTRSTDHRRRGPDQRPAARPRLPHLAGPGRGHRRLRRTRSTSPAPPRSSTATAPCCSNGPGTCSPRAATAAPPSARPARTATPPTPSTCCAPGSPATTPRTSPTTVTEHPRVFLTLTAPSFGPVHTRTITRARARHPLPLRGAAPPRRPAPRHRARPRHLRLRRRGALAGPRRAALGTASPPPSRRALAAALGVPGRRLPRPRPAVLRQGRRVPAPRARALPRRHPPRRPRRTRRPPPGRARPPTPCDAAIRDAARAAVLTTTRPDGTPLVLGWGAQLDLRADHPRRRRPARGRRRARSPTPRWPATSPSTPPRAPAPPTAADRPIRDSDHIAYLDVTDAPPAHDRHRVASSAGSTQYEPLDLRRWAHMLGFRGHFLTKIPPLLHHLHRPPRSERRTWRLRRGPRPARPRHRRPQRHPARPRPPSS